MPGAFRAFYSLRPRHRAHRYRLGAGKGGIMPEETANAGKQTAQQGAGDGSPSAEDSRTFTQEEVNRMLARERREAEARFQDYGELKDKAARLDEASGELDEARAELEALRAEKARAELVASVARDTGLPRSVIETLSGADAEELKAQAGSLAEHFKKPGGAPSVPEAGRFAGGGEAAKTTAELFADAIEESRR